MSWVTIIWSMVASACLTLAVVHLLTWCRKRTEWANLLFSLAASATAGLAFCELWMMRAETPEQFATALRWYDVPALAIIVALVGFVLIFLRAGRPWLAWAVCVLRAISLAINFSVGQNLNFREVTGLQQIPFFGEFVSIGEGVSNPWMLVGQLSLVLFVVFVSDAAITVWRRGNRQQALIVGGSIVFFVLIGTLQAVLLLWHFVHAPLTVSLFFTGIVASMAYEMSRETIRAAQLAGDLRESEARLTLAADSVGAILWDLDMNSGCIRISEKAREFFGFAKDGKICIEDFLNVIHPDDREGLLLHWEKTMQSGSETSSEYRIVRPDGSVRWVLARRRPHSAAAGPARHMIGVAIDITDQKRVEEELRESENRLRGVLESTADGILGVDSNGRVIIRNSRFNEMWRIPEELKADADDNTLLSHVLGQLSNPEDFLSKVRTLYDSYDEDVDVLHFKDGRIFERYSRPIFLPEWVMGRVWSFRDITERQRLTEISHTQSKLMEAVFDCVPGLLYLYSEDGRLIRWNKQHEYLTGYTAEELYGFAAEDWFDEEDRVTLAREFPRVFSEGRAQVELNVIHKNGDRIPYFLTGVKVIIDGGPYMVGIGIDITERRQSEAALRDSQKDIQNLVGRLISAQEEELSRLSRELHDDLTQRLAVLAIEAGKLEINLCKIPGSGRENSQSIAKIKDQLIRVSEDVHNISRQLHPTILDDLGLVRALESECSILMRRENLEIIFRQKDVPAEIGKDIALCLYRVVQEGLKNFIRHSDAGLAEIFLEGAGDSISLSIRDAGKGFDPVAVRQQRGLGLASMRERVALVGGDFSIESQPGHGTVISVSVPLTGGEA